VDPAALGAALDALMQVRAVAELRGIALGRAHTGGHPEPARDERQFRAQEMPEPAVFLADADALLDAFVAMRRGEGAALAAVLGDQIDRIAELTIAARAAADAGREKQADVFRANLETLVDASDLDEARLAQELALLAVKSDVTEELDRLHAHVAAARELLSKGGPVGRKFDFLMQEFNREANTLCSKSQDTALTAIGLDLKLAIDQTREQVQNVE
jgi:uncharacterized protein (TIGR00255 family)